MRLTLNKLFATSLTLITLGLTPAVFASSTELPRDQVENIVKRSYQYVAMYNVINKTSVTPTSNPMGTGGWNKLKRNTNLFDASVQAIARPNNDALYQPITIDLRDDAVVIDVPVIDSKNVSLETSAYDHYCDIPISTRQGNVGQPQKLLFFTARTKGYQAGEKIQGIDRYIEMNGDFAVAFFRIMPHASEMEHYQRIVGQIESLKALTLSEYQGKPAKPLRKVKFPAMGKTDVDIFGNNLLEVMQFIFNHNTFDPNDALDQAVLAAYKPLGVEPGKNWNPKNIKKIDRALFRQVAEEVAKANMAFMGDPKRLAAFLPLLFQPKGKTDLDTLVFQSVIGPIGNPAAEALYPPVLTEDGKPMNARHDYVIKMAKDELPPAKAFWSLTLYDTKHGFFIPNKQNKYSVGENTGFKLNAEGGIEVYVASEKPAGVPDENWLPINRKDQDLDIILRVYVPDLAKFKTWTAPKAVMLK